MATKRIVEGRWDCKQCGSKGILGRYRECTNCGNPRGKEVKFYFPAESEKEYVQEDEAKKINKNPDWICNFCGSYNSDSLSKCKSCGAERGSSKNYFDIQEEQQKKKKTVEADKTREEMESENYLNIQREQEDKKKRENKLKIALISIGAVALLSMIIVFLSTLLAPKDASMKITGFSWERNINVEQLKTFHESDWSIPNSARVTSEKKEIHHYEQKLDHYETRSREVEKTRISHYETKSRKVEKTRISHYEIVTKTKDLGNGYFEEEEYEEPVYETYYETEYYQAPVYETYYETEYYQEPIYRDEPVYKTKYYYDIDKWVYEKSITSSGNDQKPYWRKENLKSNERVSKKEEIYKIDGVTEEEKPENKTVEVDFEKWENFEIGQTIPIKIHVTGYVELIEE